MMDKTTVPEVTTGELAAALEAGDPMQVVDVRAPVRVAAGRIDLVPGERFHNIVGSQLIRHRDLAGTGIDPALPVTVVCGYGNDSKVLALHLSRLGCGARSLRGGMADWMKLVLARELAPPPTLDRLIQFDRIGKGALGYLLVSDGEALAVDPPRDARAYLDAAREAGARLVAVADTHVHADYLSGAPALARSLAIPYYLHPADAVYPYDGTPGRLDFRPLQVVSPPAPQGALQDGGAIPLGRSRVRVAHTPGHTEGSVTYTVDAGRSDRAVALTGDFLFIGSVGRPDLAGKVEEWTEQLWQSLEAAKRAWPPDLTVLPAHYGSDRERRGDRAVAESLSRLLETNEALRFTERGDFVAWVRGKATSFPDAYRRIKAVNVGLLSVTESEAEVLEVGRNECALGGK